jgi:hypothetical protein
VAAAARAAGHTSARRSTVTSVDSGRIVTASVAAATSRHLASISCTSSGAPGRRSRHAACPRASAGARRCPAARRRPRRRKPARRRARCAAAGAPCAPSAGRTRRRTGRTRGRRARSPTAGSRRARGPGTRAADAPCRPSDRGSAPGCRRAAPPSSSTIPRRVLPEPVMPTITPCVVRLAESTASGSPAGSTREPRSRSATRRVYVRALDEHGDVRRYGRCNGALHGSPRNRHPAEVAWQSSTAPR